MTVLLVLKCLFLTLWNQVIDFRINKIHKSKIEYVSLVPVFVWLVNSPLTLNLSLNPVTSFYTVCYIIKTLSFDQILARLLSALVFNSPQPWPKKLWTLGRNNFILAPLPTSFPRHSKRLEQT